MLDKHISAVPVVDTAGNVVGIVSEGDLLHRSEAERMELWTFGDLPGLPMSGEPSAWQPRELPE
jgi:hypothetical protein